MSDVSQKIINDNDINQGSVVTSIDKFGNEKSVVGKVKNNDASNSNTMFSDKIVNQLTPAAHQFYFKVKNSSGSPNPGYIHIGTDGQGAGLSGVEFSVYPFFPQDAASIANLEDMFNVGGYLFIQSKSRPGVYVLFSVSASAASIGSDIYTVTATALSNSGILFDDEIVIVSFDTAGSGGAGQPEDDTLTALAAYDTNGLLTQTAADTFTGRTLTGTANQVIISNGDGVAGNPTFTLPQSIGTGNIVRFDKLGLGISPPTARLHIAAGVAAASGAPIKLTSGPLLTTTEIGAVEFLTDKFYGTITTDSGRKELTLNDIALSTGRIPFTTTNGRLTDSSFLTYNGVLTVSSSVASNSIQANRLTISHNSADSQIVINRGASNVGGAVFFATSNTWHWAEGCVGTGAGYGFDATNDYRIVDLDSTERMRFVRTAQKTAIFNENAGDVDFRIESLNNTHHFFIDASGNTTGINLATPTSTLGIHGSFAGRLSAPITTYTVQATDYTVVGRNAPFTSTLPSAVTASGRIHHLSYNGSGVHTIATTSSQTIDGLSSLTISSGVGYTVQSDGANWSVIGTKAKLRQEMQIAVTEWSTDVTTGDGKGYLHVAKLINNTNLVYAHARSMTAGTTGTMDIQVARNRGGSVVDMLSTKLTIDSAETGSDTAATPYVINAANRDVLENDLLRIDIDAVQSTAAKGLLITLGFE